MPRSLAGAVCVSIVAALGPAPAGAADKYGGSKNFAAPASVPNYFANESGPLIGGKADSRVVDPPNVSASVPPPPRSSGRSAAASPPSHAASHQHHAGKRHASVRHASAHRTARSGAHGGAHGGKAASRHVAQRHKAPVHGHARSTRSAHAADKSTGKHRSG